MAKVSDTFRHHHRQLVQEMTQHAAALTDGNAEGDPESFVRFLHHELLPHAAGEERSLYPAVEPLLNAHGMATATMRMDHRAIERRVRSLEDVAARLRSSWKAGHDQARWDLARLVWQLQALFEVHLEKEEQVYLPLVEQYVPESEQQRILAQMHEVPPERKVEGGEATLDVRSVPPAATPSSWTLSRRFARGRPSRS